VAVSAKVSDGEVGVVLWLLKVVTSRRRKRRRRRRRSQSLQERPRERGTVAVPRYVPRLAAIRGTYWGSAVLGFRNTWLVLRRRPMACVHVISRRRREVSSKILRGSYVYVIYWNSYAAAKRSRLG